MTKTKRIFRKLLIALLAIMALGYLIPEKAIIPVAGATSSDWNPKTFWHEPWGRSGVHQGIDIFAAYGTPVIASTRGIVLYQGELGMGGHVVAILGPRWKLHYYAHLAQPAHAPLFVAAGQPIGAVGDSGNAVGKTPHLHYSILSIIPLPWRFSTATQGWKKMFFLDPHLALVHGG